LDKEGITSMDPTSILKKLSKKKRLPKSLPWYSPHG